VNRALAAGAAGMAVQQAILDSISANLANIDTPGFRAARPDFAALIAPDGRAMTAVAEPTRRLFSQGRLDATGGEYDLGIEGGGLFEVIARGGKTAYTRAGNFAPAADGRLVLPNGAALAGVRLPHGTTALTVSSGGIVRAVVAGKRGSLRAGQIRLCGFSDEGALALGTDGLFSAPPGSGRPVCGLPGSFGFGRIKQRYLERANVSVVAAMMAVLAAQRAYEANAKSVQAADEMLRLANNLERN